MPELLRRLLLTLLIVVLAACSPVAAPGAAAPAPGAAAPQLTIFAAASLTEAFATLAADFSATTPATVVFNFAGSQQLAQQLLSGAPADLFASANQKQMAVAVTGGSIDAATVQPFAGNRLVLVTPADNPAGLQTVSDLATPGLKLVLADAAVPVGQYALDMLANASAAPEFTPTFDDAVLANVVSYEDNVRAVLTKVMLGEADAGIVYTSDVVGAARDQVQMIDIPDALNIAAVYVIAPVANSSQPELAQAFVDFVRSDAGQSILESYGFQRVAP